MAKRIEGPYDFSPHDFRKYADGAAWELTEGEDFDEKPTVVRRRARSWARDEGADMPAATRQQRQVMSTKFDCFSRRSGTNQIR